MSCPASPGAYSRRRPAIRRSCRLAGFVAAFFAGLWLGTALFGFVADRLGRRAIFTFSLVWYALAAIGMALQHDALGLALFRFLGGIGIGVELVTIDTYIAELAPRTVRGRAFAFANVIQFCAIPLVAFLAWLLVPLSPLGVSGWRWVILIGAAGAVLVWFARRGVPESPRWLLQHGRPKPRQIVIVTGWEAEARKPGLRLAVMSSRARRRMDKRGSLKEMLAPALSQPGDHADRLQPVPGLRLLRFCQLGADAADFARHLRHHQPGLHLPDRHRRAVRAAGGPALHRPARSAK